MPINIRELIKEKFPEADASIDGRGILTLEGECANWERVVAVGHFAAKIDGVKNVVNRLFVKGIENKKDYETFKRAGEKIGIIDDVDVLIIGAGISGCGIARELSKYDLNILVVEAGEDVAVGATKANNGNIHPGHAVEPNTLKAKLNVKGNRMYTRWAEELSFDLERCGCMGAVTDERLRPALEKALKIAEINGVDGAEIISAERAYEIEPALKKKGVTSALWLPTMGLVEPYKVAVALAENAASNGVRFLFDCTVADILKEPIDYSETEKGISKYGINNLENADAITEKYISKCGIKNFANTDAINEKDISKCAINNLENAGAINEKDISKCAINNLENADTLNEKNISQECRKDLTIGKEKYRVSGAVTEKGIIKAKYIINCAGVYADEISEMAGDACYTIHPRKGVIAILDKSRKPEYNGIVEVYSLENAQAKKAGENTKGGGMCRTPEGNILMGPSAAEIPYKDDLSTTADELAYAMGKGAEYGVSYGDAIRFFAGNRPADYKEDFVIGMSDITRGFINVGGIQSPGLAAAPAIAETVEEILVNAAKRDGRAPTKKSDYNPIRKREREFRRLSRSEQDELIRRDSRYGRIVCRCESITEGEIADAMNSPVKPMSVDAIKRRTRAGMGRCQGGFCQPTVVGLLAKEQGVDWTEIDFKKKGTRAVLANNREID